MSKQQSSTPDEPEVPRKTGGGNRRARPWSVWYKLTWIGAPRAWPSWLGRSAQWHRMGRYASKEISESVVDSDRRKHVYPKYEYAYRIMHESEGKPE
jgi:hypothetical protein